MNYLYAILILAASSLSLHAQCLDNTHSPFVDQGWKSCNTSVGPVSSHGEVHWLQYNFGEVYVIDSLYIWNHNVWGETGIGAKRISIDYSTDGSNWITAGEYDVERGLGSWKYQGVHGPSLGNVEAQYVVISILETWDDNTDCAGLSEIRFSIGESVDVEDLELTESNIAISPNPSSDLIYVQLEESIKAENLIIYNAVGVKISTLNTNNRIRIPININHLADGLYFINCGSATQSFVKQ